MRHEKSSHRADYRIGDSLMNKILWILLGRIILSGFFGLGVTVIVVFCLDKVGITTRWGMIFALAVGMGAWLVFGNRLLSLFRLDRFPKKADE